MRKRKAPQKTCYVCEGKGNPRQLCAACALARQEEYRKIAERLTQKGGKA